MIIYNEASINITETTATLTWLTNQPAASRVIYSSANEPHDFNYLSPPNYGYAHSTINDLNPVTFHQVELTGLTPGTLYYYRVISQASPDTVGLSYTFTTTGRQPKGSDEQTEPGQNQSPAFNQGPGSTFGPSSENNQGGSSGNNNEEENQPEVQSNNNQTPNGQVAGEQAVCESWPGWLIVIMLIDYLILLVLNYLDKFNKELTNLKKRLSFIFALFLAAWPVLVYFFTVSFAWWAWLLVVIAYIIVLIAYIFDLHSNNYWRLNVIITLYLLLMLALLKTFIC